MNLAQTAEVRLYHGRIKNITPQDQGVTIYTDRGEIHSYPNGYLLPGFVDAHIHPFLLGEVLSGAALSTCTSAEECIIALREKHISRGDWITGRGWNNEKWNSTELPTKEILDKYFGNIPVFITRVDEHAAWVNTAALERAGISSHTPNPTNGEIVRNNFGEPTGILIDEAMSLVRSCIPDFTPVQKEVLLERAAHYCSSFGITEIHAMAVSPDELDIIRKPAELGTLPVRVQAFILGNNDEWDKAGLLPAGGEFLRVCGVKLFADGALGSRGAWLLNPYNDQPETKGLQFFSDQELLDKFNRILDAGWEIIATHAIGDAANRQVATLYGELRKNPDYQDAILRIEHAQIIDKEDLTMYNKFSIFPVVQPSHCISDDIMARQRLGEHRVREGGLYPWKSFFASGVVLAGSSDAPIESPDVFESLYYFCTRVNSSGVVIFDNNEILTRREALLSYTEYAHKAAQMDYRRGKIALDFDADFVVVDRNPETCTLEELRATKVLATYTAGVRRFTQE